MLRNRTIPYTMVYCLPMMRPIIRIFPAESMRLTGTGGLTEGEKMGQYPGMNIDLDFFERMLRIPSVTADVAQVNRVVELVKDYLEAHGLFCAVETFNGRKALFASTTEGKRPDYLLNAHLDVVPASEAMFSPVREGDRMVGRGTVDCKGAAAVAARVLIDLKGKADVGAVFSTDEETGGETTLGMVERGYGASRLICIVDANPYSIVHAQKGSLIFRLTARGRGGHSSEPWMLENPIDRLMDGYLKLRAAWPAVTPDHWCDTMAATVVRAGQAGNQVPDTAEMLVNIRFIEPGSEARIEALLRSATGLEVEVLNQTPPVFTDTSHPEMQRLRAVMAAKWPDRDVDFSQLHGATDSRHFIRLGVPVAVLGLVGGKMHCEGEWVDLRSMDEYAEVLETYLLQAQQETP